MGRSGTSNDKYLEKAIDIFVLVLNTRRSGNSIKAKQIEEITGVDTRDVEYIIRAFQKSGFPIISGSFGFKYAKCRFEFLRHIVKELHRAKEIDRNARQAQKKYIQEPLLFEQQTATARL